MEGFWLGAAVKGEKEGFRVGISTKVVMLESICNSVRLQIT